MRARFMADITDCELDDVKVGQKVHLAFRRRYTDQERGFTGYFWKAVPTPGTAPEKAGREGIGFDDRVAIVTGAGAGLGVRGCHSAGICRHGSALSGDVCAAIQNGVCREAHHKMTN